MLKFGKKNKRAVKYYFKVKGLNMAFRIKLLIFYF